LKKVEQDKKKRTGSFGVETVTGLLPGVNLMLKQIAQSSGSSWATVAAATYKRGIDKIRHAQTHKKQKQHFSCCRRFGSRARDDPRGAGAPARS